MAVHAGASAHWCSQASTMQNGEREADCVFEAAGVHMTENEQQEFLFKQDGPKGSGKFSQSLC